MSLASHPVRLILTALTVLLIAAPAAHADASISYSVSGGGNPFVSAVITSSGPIGADRVVEWRACPPDGSACTPLPETAYDRRVCPSSWSQCSIGARPGEISAGTTFEAVFEIGGVQTTRRTTAWTGRPINSALVSLSNVVAGQRARIVPGTWSGGWSSSPDVNVRDERGYAMFVCPDLGGTNCFEVRLATVVQPRDSIPLIQRWAGWYLFVDEMFGPSVTDSTQPPSLTIEAPRRVNLPALAHMRLRSAPTQVCCVLAAPATVAPKRATSPTASIRARARRGRDGQMQVARVRCAVRCAVRLTVTGGGQTVVRTLSVRGARSLTVPARSGAFRVRVVVDGQKLAGGRSRR